MRDNDIDVIVGETWHPDYTWIEGSGWHFTPGGKRITLDLSSIPGWIEGLSPYSVPILNRLPEHRWYWGDND